MGAIPGLEEHLGAAKETVVVLVPAEPFTGAECLKDPLFVEPERGRYLERWRHVYRAVLDCEDHGLRGGQRVRTSLGLVANVAASGLVVEPFAHVALTNARRLGELLGGAGADFHH